MLTCKMLPVFVVDWQLFEEPPRCKFRCHCECRNPRRHKDTDPCPMEKAKTEGKIRKAIPKDPALLDKCRKMWEAA